MIVSDSQIRATALLKPSELIKVLQTQGFKVYPVTTGFEHSGTHSKTQNPFVNRWLRTQSRMFPKKQNFIL